LKSLLRFTLGTEEGLFSSTEGVHSVLSLVGLNFKEEHCTGSEDLLQGLSIGRVLLLAQLGFVDGPPADAAEDVLFQIFFGGVLGPTGSSAARDLDAVSSTLGIFLPSSFPDFFVSV
jgi:hypothetical protein